ncbi:MAG: PIG-L deacetylase family protein [Dehalococcoidia bacterium]|nr:PIG-L deacetylase family protein [Dehalococcoidia bacterium]
MATKKPRTRKPKPEDPRKALVIVAHPDDAEFLCGGTVARWCAEGWEVNYILTTSGDMGSRDPAMTREQLAAIREKEQRAACDVLGVKDVVYLRYPDGFFEDTAQVRERLARLIKQYRPDVVVTWNPYRTGFTHRDHRLTGQCAIDTLYPLVRNPHGFPEHLEEGLEPHRVNEVLLAGSEQPDYYVDVTDHFETKIKALRRHKSQVGQANLRELKKRVRQRMAEAGKEAGYTLAEGFRRITWG